MPHHPALHKEIVALPNLVQLVVAVEHCLHPFSTIIGLESQDAVRELVIALPGPG